MRKIDLRISGARKSLANKIYKQQAIEIDRQCIHIKVNALTYHMMRQQEKVHYFQIYAEWMKRKVRARLETYLEAFKEEDVIPDEADLSNMSWAFQEVIDNFTASLPEELSAALKQLGRIQVIEDARRDIDIFANKMGWQKSRAESQRPQPALGNIYNLYINGNRGPIQQGGQGNMQNLNKDKKDETK